MISSDYYCPICASGDVWEDREGKCICKTCYTYFYLEYEYQAVTDEERKSIGSIDTSSRMG